MNVAARSSKDVERRHMKGLELRLPLLLNLHLDFSCFNHQLGLRQSFDFKISNFVKLFKWVLLLLGKPKNFELHYFSVGLEVPLDHGQLQPVLEVHVLLFEVGVLELQP